MKKLFYILLGVSLSITSCELTETPEATLTEDMAFGSESGLKVYSYSFYRELPNATEAYKLDEMADYGAVNNLNQFIRPGAFSPENSSGWDWRELRNINQFLEKNVNEAVPEDVRNHYSGIARFFRAYLYFNRVVRFGDVPWVDKPLAVEDNDILFAKRDSRTLVMDKIIEDLDFAATHIKTTSGDGTEITKWAALGLKTRVALFEASFRKYHTELNLQGTANKFYQHVLDASKILMEQSPYSLHMGASPETAQRELFISQKPIATEVMMAVTMDESLGVLGSANWWWTSPTYGPRYSLVRPFINTFLSIDGTPYTDKATYMTDDFYTETQNRDKRLQQLIRTPGYKRDGKDAAPNFNGYSYTGYQPIKYTLDASSFDNGALNNNAIPLMRWAEILLNYAEAKAELGGFTTEDWTKTIGALRKRAGITGGIDQLPTTVDPYMKRVFYKDVSSPVIMEIRRERAIELALEGTRFRDLLRWKEGELMATMPWTGMYVPALNTLMDLDRNGVPDVVFYDGNTNGPTISVPQGVARIAIGGKATNRQTMTADNHLEWFKAETREFEDRNYYYPIPANSIVKNENLEQNPGWE